MGDVEVQIFKVETYDGTLESAKAVLDNMKIADDFYHFNIRSGHLVLIKFGLVLKPGDSYQYKLPPQPFKTI